MEFSCQIQKLALILQFEEEIIIYWRGDASAGCL